MAETNDVLDSSEMMMDQDDSFAGALPKSEIQAASFVQDHPEWDGRGTVIAIFDTGVDPGASGLQRTTDGKPKIIDVIDCTGSGDVDTKKIVKADAGGVITGVNGNALRPNPAWTNPSGEWRVGARQVFEFFPAGLKARMKEERRRRWDEQQHEVVAEAAAELAAFVKSNGPVPPSDVELKKRWEELEARVKLLAEMADKYEDLGPFVDCVVWHDGSRWVAALDTSDMFEPGSGRGALTDFEPLTNYRDCLRHGTFSAEDACNFAINIYDDGATLSIVVDAGSHGTHVAGIAAGHYPDDPGLNGVAPGAQIVSCKIGDSRLGSMETMAGLTRAMITVLRNKADLINMSYGEATATPNAGRFIRLAEEIVHKHGVIFVASAGNAGPALSTVGAPGGTSSAVLGIGAYVTPALAAAGHSMRGGLDAGQQYTWSSRGPTPDGDTGVSFSAPGGAIAPVPQWTTQLRQLMNGTSMSSPCACGGLALVVSAMKAEGQAVTPARVRRAAENTALVVGGGGADSVLTYGRGLLQVASAFEYLRRSAPVDTPAELRLDVAARRSDGAATGRGIYMREPADALHAVTYQVDVKPGLRDDADVRSERLAVDLKLALRTTAPWVAAPSLLMLHHGGRGFEVEVDPTGLPEGLHYAEVQGYDAAAEWRGPLFRLPVTVIRPLILAAQPGLLALASGGGGGAGLEAGTLLRLGALRFDPGREERRFVAVPEGSTWAELRLRATDNDTPKGLMLRATHILPHTRYSDSEHRSYVQLPPHGEHLAAFAVTAGATLELTIAQFWSSLGGVTLGVELAFHGVQVEAAGGGGGGVAIDGAAGIAKVHVRAPLRRERVKPSAKLDVVRIPLRPGADADLAPLSAPRDQLPGGRTLHRLILTYKLALAEGGKVTPRLPGLNRFVYDGEIEAQMYFILDENKQLLAVGDIYPEAVALKKGDYTIRLMLRHEDPSLLDRLRHLPMVVERKLDTPVVLPVYNTNADALRGINAVTKERALCPGERVAFFVAAAPEDKLPKDATPGRQLAGTLAVGLTGGGNGKEAPGAAALLYTVPPKKAEPPSAAAAADPAAPAPAPEAALAEALRDAEVKFLQELKAESEEGRAAYDRLLADLLARFPGHLPLLREPLKRLAAKGKGERDGKVLGGIVAAADAVLAAVDATELAVFLAQKCPEEGAGAAKRKKEMEERKGAVIEALAAKCAALLDLEEASTVPAAEGEAAGHAANSAASAVPASACTGGGDGAFEAAFKELRRWVDPAVEPAHAGLLARREVRAGRYALALKALDKAASPEDKPAAREALQHRKVLLEQLGWEHWARAEEARIRRAFPLALPLF